MFQLVFISRKQSISSFCFGEIMDPKRRYVTHFQSEPWSDYPCIINHVFQTLSWDR